MSTRDEGGGEKGRGSIAGLRGLRLVVLLGPVKGLGAWVGIVHGPLFPAPPGWPRRSRTVTIDLADGWQLTRAGGDPHPPRRGV